MEKTSKRERGFRDLPLKTRLLAMDFNEIRKVYIESRKGSDEQDISLQCLIEKMLTFRQFKIVYHYFSANKELQLMLKREMFGRAIFFDDWYFLYMISIDRRNKEFCLSKMLSCAKDFYELRCVYANSEHFPMIMSLAKSIICSLEFPDNISWKAAIDACSQSPELKELLLIKEMIRVCPTTVICEQS
jgi:hypothetical protein